jgi:hypothetical protein
MSARKPKKNAVSRSAPAIAVAMGKTGRKLIVS